MLGMLGCTTPWAAPGTRGTLEPEDRRERGIVMCVIEQYRNMTAKSRALCDPLPVRKSIRAICYRHHGAAEFCRAEYDAPNFRITDFDILKSQALRVCQQVANGMEMIDAVEDLENVGRYTFDQAAAIALAGREFYCS